MTRVSLILIAIFASLSASPADACRIYTPSANLSVIHRRVPSSLSSDLFVAEVQFEQPDAGWAELRTGVRARVVRVIQGAYAGDVVIIRDTAEFRITCYAPVRYGGSGVIVGSPVGPEDGQMVLEPIFEAADERR